MRPSFSDTTPPLPPDELIDRVTSGVSEVVRAGFQSSGQRSVADISRALAAVGRSLDEYDRILEFGCGCGRIIGWLESLAASAELHGTDIDESAIAWCRDNLPFAAFGVNPHEPPTSYPDDHFDLIFNHSVFTHLDEAYQDMWLGELRRIAKPGGTVLLTVHGPQAFAETEVAMAAGGDDPGPWRDQLERDGILFIEQDTYVGSIFPDFYHSTFHAPWYVLEHWGRVFNVKAYLPGADLDFQDIVVLERPVDEAHPPPPVRAQVGDGATPPAPSAAAGGALERVEERLAHGVPPRGPSRFGRPGDLARRAILRLIRPYTAHEHDLDRDLAAAIRATQARIHELERSEARVSPVVHDILIRHSERMKRLEAGLRDEIAEAARRGRSDT